MPLLPKILIELSDFDRPEKPLTQEELVMISQVNTFTRDAVRCGDLPANFENIIPENVSSVAEKVFKKYDKMPYEDVQRSVAENLLKLRTKFSENCEPLPESVEWDGKQLLNSFNVPIRLEGEKAGQFLMI